LLLLRFLHFCRALLLWHADELLSWLQLCRYLWSLCWSVTAVLRVQLLLYLLLQLLERLPGLRGWETLRHRHCCSGLLLLAHVWGSHLLLYLLLQLLKRLPWLRRLQALLRLHILLLLLGLRGPLPAICCCRLCWYVQRQSQGATSGAED
jgi:hypothetical protein